MTDDTREPAALPDHARAWLDHYTAMHSMPRDAFVRVGRAVRAPQVRARIQRRTWITGGVLVAAALAMVWASGWLGRRELVADANDTHGLAEDRVAKDREHQAHGSAAKSVPIPAELPTITEIADPPTAVVAPSIPTRTPPSARAPSETSTLAEERALLQGAWRALAAGDNADAKTIVQRHRTRFAAGQLTDVREAIDAIVRCAALPVADRAAVRDAYARRYPSSIVLGQVREACAAAK